MFVLFYIPPFAGSYAWVDVVDVGCTEYLEEG